MLVEFVLYRHVYLWSVLAGLSVSVQEVGRRAKLLFTFLSLHHKAVGDSPGHSTAAQFVSHSDHDSCGRTKPLCFFATSMQTLEVSFTGKQNAVMFWISRNIPSRYSFFRRLCSYWSNSDIFAFFRQSEGSDTQTKLNWFRFEVNVAKILIARWLGYAAQAWITLKGHLRPRLTSCQSGKRLILNIRKFQWESPWILKSEIRSCLGTSPCHAATLCSPSTHTHVTVPKLPRQVNTLGWWASARV